MAADEDPYVKAWTLVIEEFVRTSKHRLMEMVTSRGLPSNLRPEDEVDLRFVLAVAGSFIAEHIPTDKRAYRVAQRSTGLRCRVRSTKRLADANERVVLGIGYETYCGENVDEPVKLVEDEADCMACLASS